MSGLIRLGVLIALLAACAGDRSDEVQATSQISTTVIASTTLASTPSTATTSVTTSTTTTSPSSSMAGLSSTSVPEVTVPATGPPELARGLGVTTAGELLWFGIDGSVEARYQMDPEVLGGQTPSGVQSMGGSLVAVDICCAPDVGSVYLVDIHTGESSFLSFGGLGDRPTADLVLITRPVLLLVRPNPADPEGNQLSAWSDDQVLTGAMRGESITMVGLGVDNAYRLRWLDVVDDGASLEPGDKIVLDEDEFSMGWLAMAVYFRGTTWVVYGTSAIRSISRGARFMSTEHATGVVDVSADATGRRLLLLDDAGQVSWTDVQTGETATVISNDRFVAVDWVAP